MFHFLALRATDCNHNLTGHSAVPLYAIKSNANLTNKQTTTNTQNDQNVCPDEKCLLGVREIYATSTIYASHVPILHIKSLPISDAAMGRTLIAPCITHCLVQIITFKQLDMLQMAHRETVRHPTLTAPRCTLQVKHYTDP